MSESKQDETFKVVDRRLFTAEGELRKEVAEQQDREHEAASVAVPSVLPAMPQPLRLGRMPAMPRTGRRGACPAAGGRNAEALAGI